MELIATSGAPRRRGGLKLRTFVAKKEAIWPQSTPMPPRSSSWKAWQEKTSIGPGSEVTTSKRRAFGSGRTAPPGRLSFGQLDSQITKITKTASTSFSEMTDTPSLTASGTMVPAS